MYVCMADNVHAIRLRASSDATGVSESCFVLQVRIKREQCLEGSQLGYQGIKEKL